MAPTAAGSTMRLQLMLLPVLALAQRPGPGGGSAATCATGDEGANLTLGCPPGGNITSILFADYGQVRESLGLGSEIIACSFVCAPDLGLEGVHTHAL